MTNSQIDVLPDGIDLKTWFSPEYLNFRHPKVTEFLKTLNFDPEITNTIISEDRARHLLHEGGYEHGSAYDIPIVNGTIDPPKLSKVVADRLAERYEVLLPGLSEFKYRYTTVNGATEGIDQLMVELSTNKSMKKVGLIKGDYLGYLGAARTKGIEIEWAESLEEIGNPKDGVVWFVSNPSAINGNLYYTDVWQNFLATGHKVVVDAAYVDLTIKGNSVNVDSENVIAVITSPSKPYGFVMDKHPGVVYTREKHNGLQLQKKFNNVPRLLTIMELELQEEFEPHKIATLHHPIQLAICKAISKLASRGMVEADDVTVLPSDATLMAYASGKLHQDFDGYRTVNLLERDQEYTFRITRELARRAISEC